ncbi:MAG: DUF4864 domain-containing protein [Ignavibacteria bacterium]|nr:DUF4864 domain-containing protein [Ignavibacteria bacterium]MBL7991371.1 DUF4864 domain-containing protein [Candidatus Kapabacteria bacterium]
MQPQREPNTLPQPKPEFSPDDVIRIQLDALRDNDAGNDDGIATAFNFASPGNKVYTGPLSRFKQIVRNPVYAVMLNHRSADYESVLISGTVAQQRVMITGENSQTVIYTFTLSRQRDPRYRDCWMTDGVSVDAMFWLN